LVLLANELKHEVLDSELEALLIEAELIRLHQPEYNILLKDDKSPIYLVIENKPYPAIKLVRKSDLNQFNHSATQLGPFGSAYKLKQVLRIARRIFPWCNEAENRHQTKNNSQKYQQKPCFYYHLDLCPGACINKISEKDYQQNISQLILFLKGKKKEVIKKLTKEMKRSSDQLQFEQAAKIKKKIELIQDVTSQQFRLKPDLILPALHDSKNQDALDQLRRIFLNLNLISADQKITRIEGFDVSNLMGKNAAVSMVVFTNSQADKGQYRLFNIKDLSTPNDYQMMKQAIKRRLRHPEWKIAELIIADGGKGQVRAALQAYKEVNVKTPLIIGIAKNPDRLVIPIKINDQLKPMNINWRVITFPSDHPALHLVQQVRDESHRFAKKQHTKLKRKQLLKS